MPTSSPQKQNLESDLEKKMQAIRSQQIEDAAKKRADKLGLPYLNLRSFPIDSSAVYLISENDAHLGQLAVIAKNGKTLKIAVYNSESPQTKEVLKKLDESGYGYDLVIVSELSLAIGWRRYQLKRETQSALGTVEIKESEVSRLQSQIKDIADLKDKLTTLPITQVLNILIAGALKIGASDVHFEPEQDSIRLRYRLDGVLYDVVNFSPDGYHQLLPRIKLTSGLKINVHDVPQDGRFTIKQEKINIEVRVSILPGAYGENIVMRILDPRTIKQKLEDLGMREDTLKAVEKLLEKTTGALLTTGPTGSGKTTTLYAFIEAILSPDVKIITIEDPIEYHITGISQTQVDTEAGYTFADGLRSIVRQDPDVILVGEIRDVETAEIAMQAALTGHMVFSTLHTNNAAGAIPRLIDFGIKPVTIAPAVNAVMAQRLVRRLCRKCRKKQKITSEDFNLINKSLSSLNNLAGIELSKNMEIHYPGKCAECNSTGYQGRIGVYELFEIDSEMEKLILKSPAISEIQELAVKKGLVTLLQDGLIKVVAGSTSVEEVMRVIGR